MGHTIEVVIGPATLLGDYCTDLSHAVIRLLPQGFALLPCTDALVAALPTPKTPHAATFPVFRRLTPGLVAFVQRMSQHGLVAYLETDYFGGVGQQAVVVWEAEQIVFGPLVSELRWENEDYVGPPPGEGAINQALCRLGVERGDAFDEFDALQLGRLRSTADWARGREAWRRE